MHQTKVGLVNYDNKFLLEEQMINSKKFSINLDQLNAQINGKRPTGISYE